MIDFTFAGFAKTVLAFFLAASQSSANIASAHVSMLNLGDEIDGMTLTTDAADVPPLWAFCSSEVSNHVTTANCRIPQKMSSLAIGHVFFANDSAFQTTDWSELECHLYLDDKLIDLDDFGTFDYVVPTMSPNPSPVKEVFMKFTAWDVVLTNLQPGVHTIEGRVRTDAEEYRWIVNLVIEDNPSSQRNPQRKGLYPKDIGSGCPETGEWRSGFYNACRFYGVDPGIQLVVNA